METKINMLNITKIESSIIFIILLSQVLSISILIYFIPSLNSILTILKYISFLLPLLYLSRKIYIEWRILLVITIFWTTIIINDIPSIYSAESRLISFILLIFAVGPFIFSENLQRFREKLLKYTLYFFMIGGATSFIYYLLGLPKFGLGHFTGVFSHSMLLSPIAAIGGIFALVKFKENNKIKFRIFFLILFIMCFLSVILAASRSTLFALIFVIFIFILFSKIKFKKIFIFIFICISMLSSQFISVDLAKNNITNSITERGIKNTRETLWNDRLSEFYANPFFGVGFSAQDKNTKDRLNNLFSKDGKVEPGSTYLMILSMTGIFGFISLFILFSKYYIYYNNGKKALTQYPLLILIFFLIHFIAEGYIFSSGSLMSYTFWLLIGATYPNPYKRTHL